MALALCLIVFLFGLREKHRRQAGLPEATATENFPIREFLDSIPKEWTRITWIEGQGWRIFVPCGSQAGALHIAPDSSGRMQLQCGFCGSLDKARVLKVMRYAGGGKLEIDLGAFGTAASERVNDAVQERFTEAPVKDHVLTWRHSANDSLVFVPASDAGEFETLKADDEVSEGCGTEGSQSYLPGSLYSTLIDAP